MGVQRVPMDREPATGLLVGESTQGENAVARAIEGLDDQTRAELAQLLDELNTAAAMRGACPAWRIAIAREE